MTLAPGGAPSASQLPPPRAGQGPDNRLEQILVRHMLGNVVETLTDRHGTTHPFPWLPDQQVRVGVLGVTFNTPPPGPPGGTQGPGGSAGPTGDGSEGEGSDGNDGSGPGGPQPLVAAPVDNRGVIGVDFVVAGGVAQVDLAFDVEYAIYHPLIPAFPDVSQEAQNRSQAAQSGGGNRRRRPTVPINPTWVRDNRHVTFTITVPVGADEEEASCDRDIPGGDPLEGDATTAVANHYATPNALWMLRNNQTLPVADAMGTEAEFWQGLANRRDTSWQPSFPQPRLSVTTMPTVDGEVAVSVSIVNARTITDRTVQDLSVYDTRMTVTVVSPGQLVPKCLGFANDDLRYAEVATVVGRGRGCVAEPGEPPNSIVAQTLPVHVQQDSPTRTHGVDLSFARLAAKPLDTLDRIASAMRSFHRQWDFSAASTPEARAQLTNFQKQFEEEVERFDLGCDLLRNDQRLNRAFVLANKAFAAARPRQAWRLFQLVFIVAELGALAARDNPTDARLRQEIDAVDVIWFPTGGGKTEAYLGLIVVALFFDRLRGKHRGTSAQMLFPLRMLSVQQLARVSHIIHHAEATRDAENVPGDPFNLGYLVGSGNTPNRLAPRDPNSWWPGLDDFARWPATERDRRRLVGACPACGDRDSVGLDTDVPNQRLLHVCRQCGHQLPICASDDEVTRYMPAIVVSTVDKVTAFSRNGQLTSFNRGPRKQCPQHGYYTHKACIAAGCTTNQATHTDPTGFIDPTPALWVQDELHLVREELGVFAGHYHTLFAELAIGAGHLPSKVIAASATIEQYEDQLSQVYGRTPRMFPTGGPTLRESFYTEVTDDIRRIYLGVLPSGGGTVKVDLAAGITALLVEQVHNLTDDPTPLIAAWAADGISVTRQQALGHLFRYELALAYVNSKAHGVVILDDINLLSEKLLNLGSDQVRAEYLTGETTLGELAAVVAAIEQDVPPPRRDRIRALVGTAVISHGVDLDRLNWLTSAGMPSSYAHYIQATARAGRTHVGLVVSVFDRNNRRETSMFQSFNTTHAALERMVEPVPVNRFATRAVERTLPGIVCALLWDETRNPAWPSTEEISTTRRFRPWWNANAAQLIPQLRTRIERAYRCPVPNPAMAADEQRLVADALNRWENVERLRMQQWQAEWLTELFTSAAMISLRDVDPPVEFPGGNRASQIITRLH